MNKIHSLVSVKKTWELTYKEDGPRSGSAKATLIGLISVIAAPVISIVGVLILINSTSRWAKSYQKRDMAARMLKRALHSDESELNEQAKLRIKHCEIRIDKLKAEIKKTLSRHLWDSAKLDIGVPQRKNMYDYLSRDIPDSYWNDFSWDDFLKKDFLECDDSDKDKVTLNHIEKLRIRLASTINQKEALKANSAILKDIYEFKCLKNIIKIEDAKKWVLYGTLCTIPTGLFFGITLFPIDDKKWFKSTQDSVDWHNKFIKKPYLAPYFT